MITSVTEFARYWDGVRRRTWAAVDRVGPELLDWAPRPGEMTCGEIVRHLAGAELFTEALDPGPALDYGQTRARLDHLTLTSPRRDLDGASVKAWRFLMAMVEPPQIFGRRMEEVLAQVARAGSTGGPR